MAHARGCHHKERRYNWLIRRGFDWCTWFESSGCGGQWQFVCHSTWSILFDFLSLFFCLFRVLCVIYNVRVHDHHDAPKQLILQMLWHMVWLLGEITNPITPIAPELSEAFILTFGGLLILAARKVHDLVADPSEAGRTGAMEFCWSSLSCFLELQYVTMITVIIEYIFLWMQLMHLEVVPVFSNQWMWQLFSDCAGHLYEYMHGWHGATPACWRGCCAVLHHATPPDDCVQWCLTNDKS
jgi:hypothetical protein